MLHGETVVLTDMLDCRERRARKQDEYREKYHTTIISFCMNIPRSEEHTSELQSQR